jgi:UDP-N-acetylmuramate--alanine ligase
VVKNEKNIQKIDSGLIIGFGAGDITYQIRGTA